MSGSHGATFVLFGLIVWLLRWSGVTALIGIDPRWLQAIALLMIFGFCIIVVRMAIHIWLTVYDK